MLDQLSKKFAWKLIDAGIIAEEDADVYIYGFFQACMLLLNISTTLFLGIFFQVLIPCIVLNVTFIPLRINAGGHHADSPVKCYINSTLKIAALLAIIKWISIHPVVLTVLVIITAIVNIIFAPVESSNNPLDEKETVVYRKRTMIILAIEVILFFLSLLFMEKWIPKTMALGMISECLLVVLGVLNNVGILKKK